jgi:hypothetical protein
MSPCTNMVIWGLLFWCFFQSHTRSAFSHQKLRQPGLRCAAAATAAAAAATTAATAAATAGRHTSSVATASNLSSCRLLFSPRPPPSRLLVSSVVAPDPDDDDDDNDDAVSAASTATTTAARVCCLPACKRRRIGVVVIVDVPMTIVATRCRRRLDLIVASLCAYLNTKSSWQSKELTKTGPRTPDLETMPSMRMSTHSCV